MTKILLNKNFNKPSNVCARPEIMVPIAENAVPMTPKIVSRMD